MNKPKNRILLIALFALLVIALPACGGGQADDEVAAETVAEEPEAAVEEPTAEPTAEPRSIAYVAWNMNNPWSVILRDAIKEAVEANGDIFFESDPGGDPALQIPQIETFIGQGVDGIILTPTDAQAVIPAIQAADDAGIPVVIVGAGVNEGAWKAAILTDNFAGGKQIGEYIVALLGGEGKVVASDVPGIKDAEERRAGWEAAFEGTNIEILDYQTAGTVEAGVTIMENWLQQFDDISAVMGVNDPTALGALTVIEEAGLEGQITVVGVDGSEQAIEAMTACRSFGASAAQAPGLMGTMAVETLYDIFDGKEVQLEVRVATELLPREDYCSE